MAMKRRFARMSKPTTERPGGKDYKGQAEWDEAHPALVSSMLTDGRHSPAIDIDGIEVKAVPSRSKGSYHLYIEHAMPWWKYRLLLRVMVLCGLVERGYYRASVAKGASFLRLPSRDGYAAFPPRSTNPKDVRYQNDDVFGGEA